MRGSGPSLVCSTSSASVPNASMLSALASRASAGPPRVMNEGPLAAPLSVTVEIWALGGGAAAVWVSATGFGAAWALTGASATGRPPSGSSTKVIHPPMPRPSKIRKATPMRAHGKLDQANLDWVLRFFFLRPSGALNSSVIGWLPQEPARHLAVPLQAISRSTRPDLANQGEIAWSAISLCGVGFLLFVFPRGDASRRDRAGRQRRCFTPRIRSIAYWS